MATTLLRRSSAVWIPPRSVGERALVSEPSLVVVAGSLDAGAGARSSRTSLEALPSMKSAVLVFDARDVTLLPVRMPALSGARLYKALPNLLEDSLLQDAASCAFALGPTLPDGQRLVAVIDRGWLEFVIGAFERRGIKVSAAWPAQLVLPQASDQWTVACVQDGLTMRTGEFEGLGWSAGSSREGRVEALCAAIGSAALTAALPRQITFSIEDASWASSVDAAVARLGITANQIGLSAVQPAAVDLLQARRGSASSRWLASIDWRAWRLPAGLALGCVFFWLLGLNLHWAQLSRERAELRADLESQFRKAFPRAQVVVDPLLQMQRQVAQMRLNTGSSGSDDFLPMLARLSLALGPRANDALTSLEFRAGLLRARFRADFFPTAESRTNLQAALVQRGLQVKFEGEDQTLAVIGPGS